MEAPKTNWTEKDILIAASQAPRLSALLKNESKALGSDLHTTQSAMCRSDPRRY